MRQGFPLRGDRLRVTPVDSTRAEAAGVIDAPTGPDDTNPGHDQYAACVTSSGPLPISSRASGQPALPFTLDYLVAAQVVPVGTPAAGNATILTDADGVSGCYYPPAKYWFESNKPPRAQKVAVIVVGTLYDTAAWTSLAPAFASHVASLNALGVHVYVTSGCRRCIYNPFAGPVLVSGGSVAQRHPNVGGSTALTILHNLYTATTVTPPSLGDVYWAVVGANNPGVGKEETIVDFRGFWGYTMKQRQSGLSGTPYTATTIPGMTSLGVTSSDDGFFVYHTERFADVEKATADRALLQPYIDKCRSFRFTSWTTPDPGYALVQGGGAPGSTGHIFGPYPGSAAQLAALLLPDADWLSIKQVTPPQYNDSPQPFNVIGDAEWDTIAAEIAADALAFFTP